MSLSVPGSIRILRVRARIYTYQLYNMLNNDSCTVQLPSVVLPGGGCQKVCVSCFGTPNVWDPELNPLAPPFLDAEIKVWSGRVVPEQWRGGAGRAGRLRSGAPSKVNRANHTVLLALLSRATATFEAHSLEATCLLQRRLLHVPTWYSVVCTEHLSPSSCRPAQLCTPAFSASPTYDSRAVRQCQHC